MGAYTFETIAKGKTAQDAFNTAVEQARYEHGHGGYSGTIAEKRSFVMIGHRPMTIAAAQEMARKLIDDGDGRIDNKWGPAGCIPLDDGRWFFFGWASS